MPNRLATETSPYLRQHADNPVDWYPWGDEALARARTEDRPLLVSIGYAACHWCHVMERESFEDEATARLMNERFVCVKVDREERPDVDAIYMQATQAMTGHGGWPMTVFATPAGEPFYCGTYFPPDDRHGVPSFRRVLASVAEAWQSRRDAVARTAGALRDMYAEASRAAVASGPLTEDILVRAVRAIAARHDPEHGGPRGAPKFPPTMAMDFLLRRWARTGDESLLAMVLHTYKAMARGGIYDQVGGGFHRYAVDEAWLVPHFEKMLYDNALLVRLGVHLWQATGDGEARRVSEETLAWVAREMTAAGGGFYASLDADSEGHEGRFYVWGDDELRARLGDDYDAAARYWGVTPAGNFEGRSIPFVRLGADPAAQDGDDAALADVVRRARATLLAAREARVRPARDEKILAGWNGLMLRAVAEAARAFGDPSLRAMAVRNAEFLATTLVDRTTGRVTRVHAGGISRIPGFLEDHAAVALGFLAVYELTLERPWLDLARRIGAATAEWFWDDAAAAFFDTARDHERLVGRPREAADNASPSGTALAVELELRLADLFGGAGARRRADWTLETLAEPMARHAPAFGHLLGAADMAVDGAVELTVAGDPAAPAFRALLDVAAAIYVPSLVIAGGAPGAATTDGIAMLDGRGLVDGRPAAYVCRRRACAPPVTAPDALAALLVPNAWR